MCSHAVCAAICWRTLEPLPPPGDCEGCCWERGAQTSAQAPALDSLGSYFFVCLALTKATSVDTRSTFLARWMNTRMSCKSWSFSLRKNKNQNNMLRLLYDSSVKTPLFPHYPQEREGRKSGSALCLPRDSVAVSHTQAAEHVRGAPAPREGARARPAAPGFPTGLCSLGLQGRTRTPVPKGGV